MTIWLAAELPPTLATWLVSTLGIRCVAIRDLGPRDADERVTLQAARDQGRAIIMSRDSDFVELGLPTRVHGRDPSRSAG